MKFLISFLTLLACVTASAQDFTYTYEGQTLNYTVIDEALKICKVSSEISVSGDLVIPSEANGYKVFEIDESAFFGCSSLTSVTIGNGVTSIGTYAFYDCSALTSVTIPDGVTSIGDCAFSYCSGLTSVTIGNGVTSIGLNAFYYCSGLTSVTIPDGVTSIGDETFFGCSSLTSVTIPDGVTSIGDDAFSSCSGLTSITIGNGVTSIGRSAFSGCSGLTVIYSSNTTPPSAYSYSFDNNHYQNATLYVPDDALEAYKTAEVWKEFLNIQGFDPTGIETVGTGDSNVKDVYYDLNGRRLHEPMKGLNIINGKKVMVK